MSQPSGVIVRLRPLVVSTLALALATPLVASALPAHPGPALPVADPTVAAARDTEPVILTGASYGTWAAPANVTAKAPLTDFVDCPPSASPGEGCAHNHYVKPEVDSADYAAPAGTPVDAMTGWRWDVKKSRFTQVPFQVDQMFVRYLDNSASGFAIYSGEDQHLSYEFDREGFRYTKSDPSNPCLAIADSPPATDPVKGLDTNDETVFMASDAGAQAPTGAALPAGATDFKTITVRDPLTQATSYLYVMLHAKPEMTQGSPGNDGVPGNGQGKGDGNGDGHGKGAGNDHGVTPPVPSVPVVQPYVHYQRDANADTFALSQSSYSNYGNAATGIYCDAAGNIVRNPDGSPKIGRRRPRDGATITTDRYTFRYDGRWLMTQLHISKDGGQTYGPDIIDRWKARAFAQDPGSNTPCCGYEEEDTNWGGSSTLMGERCGPVRCIRETWGADSGTNVVRRETFYRDEMRQRTFLRVHVIPPMDGIYAQWDYNAGLVDTFSNSQHPEGVKIDGRNDEAIGNLDDPCNHRYDANDTSSTDQTYRSIYQQTPLCSVSPYHQSMDPGDPTFAEANAALGWTEVSGDNGTVVSRYQVDPTAVTPGGAAQTVDAVPYYRDDSCFDDGTGSDPGPKLHLRSGDEPLLASDGTPRRCWKPSDGIPVPGDDHFFQGSIGTNGVHLLFLAESDNARQTVPIDEIVFGQRMVYLPGRQQPMIGEKYGRGTEKPLVATVS